MSDDVLSIIPSDPYWQLSREAGDRAAAIVAELEPGDFGDGVDIDIDVSWHDIVTVVDCGANLERIGCPKCGTSIDTDSWGDLLEERHETGFDNLVVSLPCCGAETSLNELAYEWPCGFAKFEIAIWNPERAWFTDEELSSIGGRSRPPRSADQSPHLMPTGHGARDQRVMRSVSRRHPVRSQRLP